MTSPQCGGTYFHSQTRKLGSKGGMSSRQNVPFLWTLFGAPLTPHPHPHLLASMGIGVSVVLGQNCRFVHMEAKVQNNNADG